MSAWHDCVATMLRGGHTIAPSSLVDMINDIVREAGIDVNLYLVDREQVALRALPRTGVPPGDPLPIESTVAGRAFMHLQAVVPPGAPDRILIPMVDGADRLGVAEISAPEGAIFADESVRTGAELMASAIGYLVVVKNSFGDTIRRARRSQPMSVGGELLWRALPPLTLRTTDVSLAAALEPCYDVGGDAFDYAYDEGVLHVGIFDAVGRGLSAALTSTLTLAATRARRAARYGLASIVTGADEALTSQFSDMRYTTAILAELDRVTGTIRYVNAGHPPAVVIREGRAVFALDADPRPPLGLGDGVTVAERSLEPGDRVLFYTDGVTEARDADGNFFGLDRLLDLAERHASGGLLAAETLRRLSLAVLEYEGGQLHDDATLMLVEWAPDAGVTGAG